MVLPRLELGEVNRATTVLDGAAGKSVNVAKVLKTLGEEPIAVGFLGGDRGEEVRTILNRCSIECEFVLTRARTRQCITVLDKTKGTQTELVEESPPVTSAEFAELLRAVQRRLPRCRAAVMSGTLAPGVPQDFYFQCARLAQEAGALTVVDAKGEALAFALRAKPGLVKPNRAELAATVGRELRDERQLMAAMRELQNAGAERVIVTAGAQTTLAFGGTTFYRVRSPRIQVKNPIGSGDAFTAAVVARLIHGDDLGEACRWGTAAGGANALTLMPGELNRSDVERLLPSIQVTEEIAGR
jgi:tagatose 6-phosphate kinase